MITLVTISRNESLPYLISNGKGVYKFSFKGDLTYTDDYGIVFTWENVLTTAPIILGVRTKTTQLVEVSSLTACEDTDNTYFYDIDDNGTLYVHWDNSVSDISVGRELTIVQIRDTDTAFSNRFSFATRNIFEGVYYKPIANGFTGFNLRTDSLKFGLLDRQDSRIKFDNTDGFFDTIEDTFSLGSIIDVRTIATEETDFFNGTQRFKGFTNGSARSEKTYELNLIEQRFFTESLVCQNTFDSLSYPDIEDRYIGKRVPVSLGYIRRGIAVPINTDGVTKEDAVSVTFVLSDSSLGSIQQIDALYDNNGNEIAISSSDLGACTVTFNKPADTDLDLSNFSWDGIGLYTDTYIDLYDNPVETMIWAFETLAGVPYVSDTFDITSWDAARTEFDGSTRIGMSIQSDKSFIEEILQTICASIQGVILSKGTGVLTIVFRNTAASTKRTIAYKELNKKTTRQENVSTYASSVTIEYSKSPVTNRGLNYTFTGTGEDAETETIKTYGKQTQGAFNPFKSVLHDNTGDRIESLASDLLEISNEPEDLFDIESVLNSTEILPFDLITVDLGRKDSSDTKTCEVLEVTPNYNNYNIAFKGRVLE